MNLGFVSSDLEEEFVKTDFEECERR